MADPSPLTWTLRFKSHKTTLLIHTDPLNTFSAIKSYLYNALQETGIKDSSGDALSLPDSAEEIQLGRPVDIHDASQGFRLGDWELSVDGEEEEENGDADEVAGKAKGKGKAKAGSASGSSSAKKMNGSTKSGDTAKNCPKGAGLKDGAVLAFRWDGDGVWDGVESAEGKMWGVKLASFEDAYGVENEGDVGGGREFEG